MKYRYEGKYKGKHPAWEPIDEAILRDRLATHFSINFVADFERIEQVMDSLRDGQAMVLPFTTYRALPVEAVEDPDVLREWFLGEWPKAQTVKEFLAPLVREIVREELELERGETATLGKTTD